MDVFGSSGVRGVANEAITPAFVLRVAMAAGSLWTAQDPTAGRVAVGRDTRLTGSMLAEAAASGLASVGFDVDRVGVVPTPALQAYAERDGVPAVMITASHNPPEYNGVKLVGPDGVELSRPDLERIEAVLNEDEFATARWDATGAVEGVDATARRYVEGVLGAVDRERIDDADLRVAIDPGHGAAAETSPRIFRELGCEVVTVNAQPDGQFPGRDPEPVTENLGDLGRLVRAADADLGIAHDGDGDRAIFCDEEGEYVEGDAALAVLAAAELDAGDTTVSAVNVSQRLVDVARDAEAALDLTPIGSTHIISRIRELREGGAAVPIAGEGNGGIIFPDYRLARDGAYTAARFCELLADGPASAIVADYDGYHNVRENLPYGTDGERGAMLAAAERHAEAAAADLTTIDGYRLDYGDAWVLVRPSGTEPLIRIYAEARDPERAAALAEELRDGLEAAKVEAEA